MKVFATDLDNTMIYSYKRDIGKNTVLVETKDGKELSFMTKESYQTLNIIRKELNVIPVTTRSLEQYNRLIFSKENIVEYALVSNGGVLLKNNKIDMEWYSESLKIVELCKNEMEKGVELLKKDKNIYFEIRKIDGLFIFTKTKNILVTLENLKNNLCLELIDVHNHGEKIYIFPKALNKGEALKRLKKVLGIKELICSGDSEMDIPMLKAADISIFPEELIEHFSVKDLKVFYKISKDKIFSDEVLAVVQKYMFQ